MRAWRLLVFGFFLVSMAQGWVAAWEGSASCIVWFLVAAWLCIAGLVLELEA